MANQGINYASRNYADIRSGLVDMVKQYYQMYLAILTMRLLV